MKRFVFATLGLALAGAPALAQNLSLPVGTVNTSQPSSEISAPAPNVVLAPRLHEGRSAYDAPRVHHRKDHRS